MAGKTFALVFAPSLRGDTFVHLNREGDHWKFRWYSSPDARPTEFAQSGAASIRMASDIRDLQFVHEISSPYSTSPGGVSVLDATYWFNEIAKANDAYGIGA